MTGTVCLKRNEVCSKVCVGVWESRTRSERWSLPETSVKVEGIRVGKKCCVSFVVLWKRLMDSVFKRER